MRNIGCILFRWLACPIPSFFIAQAIVQAILFHHRLGQLVWKVTGAILPLQAVIYYCACTDVCLCIMSLVWWHVSSRYSWVFPQKHWYFSYLTVHSFDGFASYTFTISNFQRCRNYLLIHIWQYKISLTFLNSHVRMTYLTRQHPASHHNCPLSGWSILFFLVFSFVRTIPTFADDCTRAIRRMQPMVAVGISALMTMCSIYRFTYLILTY